MQIRDSSIRVINMHLLNECADSGNYSTYAFFVLLKHHFNHGRFPHYRAVAEKLNVSPKTVVSRMARLKKEGLVEKRGRVYWIRSNGKLDGSRIKLHIKINTNDTLKDVEKKLQYTIIRFLASQQELLISEKKITENAKTDVPIALKAVKRLSKKYGSVTDATIALSKKYKGYGFVMFDNKWLAKKLSISPSSVQNLKRFLIENMGVKVKKVYKKIMKTSKETWGKIKHRLREQYPSCEYSYKKRTVYYVVGSAWTVPPLISITQKGKH